MRPILLLAALLATDGAAGMAMAVGPASPAVQSDVEGKRMPDFSNVRSAADAERLAKEGKLVRVLLFPAAVGGEDTPQNVVYVPPQAAATQELIIGTLVRFVDEGTIDKLNVAPEYRGDSFIPVRIRYDAYHSSRPGRFEPVIEIW